MDSYNLKTASSYINNLLLARGLLRNGKPIDWANPSKGEGGKEATMAAIINVVHNLILRRDRDQNAHESLAQTLRSTRTELSQSLSSSQKLARQITDLARQTSLAQSQERAAKLALRSAESAARALREEIARQKVTLQQIRTSCANDVRKRDVQLQRLKTHLSAQQRGRGTGAVSGSIVITPGTTIGIGFGSTSHQAGRDPGPEAQGGDHYDLSRETTEFLTQLSQSLSDENDNLIGLVRSTIATLRELQGLPESVTLAEGSSSHASGSPGESDQADGMMQALPTSYSHLASDMDSLLENLRTLLTNPNFVSLEEVEMREAQIVHLRQGWTKMEERWREAVVLMESWKRRMRDGGDTVNLEDLKRGLGLGIGLETVNGENDISTISEGEEEEEMDTDAVDGENELTELDEALKNSDDVEESLSGSEHDDPPVLTGSEPVKRKARDTDLFNLKLPRNHHKETALQESTGNSAPKSPRKVNFAPSATSTPHLSHSPSEIENRNEALEINAKQGRETSSPLPTASLGGKVEGKARVSQRGSRLPRTTSTSNSTTAASRKRRSTSPHPAERGAKLTVKEKLWKVEMEAAAVAEGLQVERSGEGGREGKREGEEVQERRSPAKASRVKGKARRRKSTLTPGELEELMFAI